MQKKYSRQDIEHLILENQIINSENSLTRLPQYEETSLLENIRNGNYKEVSFMTFEELEPYMGKTTTNSTKKIEYYSIAAIALGSRAAIEGGLKADLAYDISDALMEKLSMAKSSAEFHNLTLQGLTYLAHRVYLSKRSQSSYILEQVKVYIAKNIFSKIYLKDIAAYVGTNPTYLSHIFAEQTGMSIQNYIQKEKIDRACNMLQYSDRSVAEISQYLTYQSQSHFSQIFKQYKGVTPKQYRKVHKSTAFSHI